MIKKYFVALTKQNEHSKAIGQSVTARISSSLS